MKLKVRLDFCDFWQNFVKTKNFFHDLLSERFDLELCDRPDFILYADRGQHLHRVHNCVKIYVSIESDAPDFGVCDYAFTSHYLDNPRHMRLPYYALTTNPKWLVNREQDTAAVLAKKTKFCSFVVSNSKRAKTQKRIEFFQRLCQVQKSGFSRPRFQQHRLRPSAGPVGQV